MDHEFTPIWLLFSGTILVVMLSLETGYRLGHRSRRKSEGEKEAPISTMAGSVLGLVAFMMAFTFGIVSNRYEGRKNLVREEANCIGTAYLRADFLPDPDRAEAKALLKEYVADRLMVIDELRSGKRTLGDLGEVISKAGRIHERLWGMAIMNAEKNMDSDVYSLYITSLNDLIDLHAMRVAVSLQARIPAGIWFSLGSLTMFGMVSIGYQMGIAGSRRSLVQGILAISFSIVIALIATLDRPDTTYITVSQQPFIDLLNSMK